MVAETQKQLLAAQKDTASMMTLGTITILFLPSSFFASLFSTSLFELSDVIEPNAVITYWVISAPLALLSVSTWGLWSYVQRDRNSKRLITVSAHHSQQVPVPNTRTKARRQIPADG